MKKKWKILSFVVVVTAFPTLSLTASYASGYQSVSTVANVNIQNASKASVEPQAIASLARKAWVVATEAYKANKDALREVTRLGSLLGTGVSSTDVDNADVIFDK
ncbi:hypothetical protein [Paenibacillus massiliensis]|uniref:hypothetical protein n=1 Tax=Paenibacillus massiliensis TaxID=225917 RepID=UPI00046F3F37|nr:hypothetical protein [Paenibacillus massiliensis]